MGPGFSLRCTFDELHPEAAYDDPGMPGSPSSLCRGLSARPGTMVASRQVTTYLEKTLPRFQGFPVRADLRGSDNRRDRLSLSRLLEM
jgi:hypothetical protein